MIVIYHTSTHTSKHHPAPSIGTKSPRSTVNMVTWTNWICDERNSVEGAAVWACTHTHTLHYDLNPHKKHHPTPSNELQRNSAGEHWINRSPHSGSQQLPSSMLVKYLQRHLARYDHQRLLIGASISLLQRSYNAETRSSATKNPIANKSVITDAWTTSKQVNFLP